MSQKALGKQGWSVVSGLLLCTCVGAPVLAAPNSQAQVAIGSPLPNSLVGGKVTLSVAFNTGTTQISAFTVFVDDQVHYSRNFIGMTRRGINYLDLDTTTLVDGNHTVKIVAVGSRGPIASDEVKITIKNGVIGGPDVVPPLVQFRNLMDGDEVSGEIDLDILAEDNAANRLLVSLFVNQDVRMIRNTPPYGLRLDTARYLDPVTHRGEIRLEAWAFDDARNKGMARPITLKVVPAPSQNRTPKKDDPITTRLPVPDLQPREIAQPMMREPMGGEVVIPLGGRSESPLGKAAPTAPALQPSGAEARPVTAPGERNPGSKPVQPRVARAAATVTPDPAPAASEPRPTLGASRAVQPAPRPAASVLPEPVRAPRTKEPMGPRAASGSPAPAKPVLMAKVLPVPAPAAPVVRDTAPVQPVAPDMIGTIATTCSMPDITVTLPVPSADPMQSPGGQRPAAPSQPRARASKPAPGPRMAKAARPKPAPTQGEALVVVVPSKANPNEEGRVPAQVFRVRSSMPQDRNYRMAKADSLTTVAKKFGVTPKSIMVANHGQIRPGSIIKVPGAFDVVLNGEKVDFDVSPRVENGIPLAPFRQIFEHTGGTVLWVPNSQEVRAASDTRDVKLKIGSKEAIVNKGIVLMEREAFLDSGRTIVPMSFLEKALELKAEYDVKTGAVILARR